MRRAHNLRLILAIGLGFPLPPVRLHGARIRLLPTTYWQEAGVAPSLGKLDVPAKTMTSHCLTRVSPAYPAGLSNLPAYSTVMVRVVIWKSGSVSPVRAISGQPALQNAAMNAVRLWRYKPYVLDGTPMDVTTSLEVDFDASKPGGMITHPNL